MHCLHACKVDTSSKILVWLGWGSNRPRLSSDSPSKHLHINPALMALPVRSGWGQPTPPSQQYPIRRTPAFIQPLIAFVTAPFSSPLSYKPWGLEKLHTMCGHGLNLNSPFISGCNNLLVPLTLPVSGELGHYQWLVRMKGNTSPRLWKYQHLLYFSCYLWLETYNWSHGWDRNHMQRETNFNPLLAHRSWVLSVC